MNDTCNTSFGQPLHATANTQLRLCSSITAPCKLDVHLLNWTLLWKWVAGREDSSTPQGMYDIAFWQLWSFSPLRCLNLRDLWCVFTSYSYKAMNQRILLMRAIYESHDLKRVINKTGLWVRVLAEWGGFRERENSIKWRRHCWFEKFIAAWTNETSANNQHC